MSAPEGWDCVCPVNTQPQCPAHSRCSIKTQCTGGEIQAQREEETCPTSSPESSRASTGTQLSCSPSASQASLPFPAPEHTRAQALCSPSQHSLLLNFTFTFTQFQRAGTSVGWGLGEGQVPLRSQDPWLASPDQGRGGSIRPFNLWAPALHVHTHSKPAAPHT